MLAIIPARGGSKTLPRKNVLPMMGEPLIAHSIRAALGSKHITEVVVSTDDQEIANTAIEAGATVPFMRPAELAQDSSLAMDAYLYTIERLQALNPEKDYDSFVVMLPTSPLRTSSDIDAAIDLFRLRKADSVVSYAEQPHPIQWSTRIDADGKFLDLRNDLKNRQDYQTYYYPVGAVYVFKLELLRQRKYYSENSFAYVIPKSRAVEIDTEEDFMYAETLMRLQRQV
ncbi:MAG: acylneuraminate cytidylyltransferase family protein [Cyclobacteriaceae bacterium]|nr:acylneuraminate cytidylyltransferase family protein [Cyclobacteriaceae bacterium]